MYESCVRLKAFVLTEKNTSCMVHIIVSKQSANLSTILSAIIRIYSLQIMARRGLRRSYQGTIGGWWEKKSVSSCYRRKFEISNETLKTLKKLFQHGSDFKANCVFNENKSKILAHDIGATLSSHKYS